MVGTATVDGPGFESGEAEIFRTHSDRPRGSPRPLYKGYRVSSRGVNWRAGRGTGHSPLCSAVVGMGRAVPLPALRLMGRQLPVLIYIHTL